MKSHSILKKIIATCLMVVAIPVFLAAQSRSTEVTTEPPPPDLWMSGLIGLVRGQAASLSITNSTRDVQEAQFFFLDMDGNLLKTSSARIMPGQSMGLTMSRSEVRDPSLRVQVRGVVRLADPPNPDADPPQPDLVLSSLEVFDESTGKTSFGLLVPAVRSVNVYFPF